MGITSGAMHVAYSQETDTIAPLQGDFPSPVRDFDSVTNIPTNIARWLYTMFFVVAIILFLIAAYNYLMGGQDEKRIEIAKKQLRYGVIAVVIALLSSGASLIVQTFLQRASG